MLRRLALAAFFALGLSGAGAVSGAQAAVVPPGIAAGTAQAAASMAVTDVQYYYRRPYYRPYDRPYYRRPYYYRQPYYGRPRYGRPYYGRRCVWVQRRVWTQWGYRWVNRRVCRW
jgi:hypothetical protein